MNFEEAKKLLEEYGQEHILKDYDTLTKEQQENLLGNPDTPATGPRDSSVAVVEFFDYQCIFCCSITVLI